MKRKPKIGQTYWMINSRFEVKETTNTGSQKAQDRIAAGNYFKSRAQAYNFANLVRGVAQGKLAAPKRKWWKF